MIVNKYKHINKRYSPTFGLISPQNVFDTEELFLKSSKSQKKTIQRRINKIPLKHQKTIIHFHKISNPNSISNQIYGNFSHQNQLSDISNKKLLSPSNLDKKLNIYNIQTNNTCSINFTSDNTRKDTLSASKCSSRYFKKMGKKLIDQKNKLTLTTEKISNFKNSKNKNNMLKINLNKEKYFKTLQISKEKEKNRKIINLKKYNEKLKTNFNLNMAKIKTKRIKTETKTINNNKDKKLINNRVKSVLIKKENNKIIKGNDPINKRYNNENGSNSTNPSSYLNRLTENYVKKKMNFQKYGDHTVGYMENKTIETSTLTRIPKIYKNRKNENSKTVNLLQTAIKDAIALRRLEYSEAVKKQINNTKINKVEEKEEKKNNEEIKEIKKKIYTLEEIGKIVSIQKNIVGFKKRKMEQIVDRMKIRMSVIEIFCLLLNRIFNFEKKKTAYKKIEKYYFIPFSGITNELSFEDHLNLKLLYCYYNIIDKDSLGLDAKNKKRYTTI